ncbi:hypothetical protein CERSUDRAFT_84543 [Gelatoporia subvermispora B]|uniref:Cytochrome P450 n=1 Tax=Ceriporiopsis subvermispora (strain B) TaxID=914234 RepID=M2PJM7_CERS8|nr:hypothetical protein CERSUDRAFT_84543 [Gelatoporia subvermispora B]
MDSNTVQSLVTLAGEHVYLTCALGVLGLALARYLYVSKQRNALPLPPGPTPRPLIGNLFEMPSSVDWGLLEKWRDQYGDLTYMSALGYSVLVLNTERAVYDLFDRRGEVYSHRPRFVMAGEMMGLGKSMALIDYNPQYKQLRKLCQHALNADAVRKYHPVQEAIAVAFVRSLLRTPDKFLDGLRLTLGRVVLAITYGLSVDTADSEYIAEAEDTMALISRTTLPGAHLVDLLPSLQHIPEWAPGGSFHKEARRGFWQIYNFVTRPFEHVKKQMEAGLAPSSFVSDLLSDADNFKDDSDWDIEDGIKWAAGTMYGGGVETSYATLAIFFLLMALHPEKQAAAQREIDAVVGQDRLPRIADREQLPYVSALIQEVMRWHVVTPLSIARRTAQDDVYNGYRIPKGTVVVPNVWALSQMNCEDPQSFKPERFLGPNKPASPNEYIFGFGRRLCPGKYLAEANIFAVIADTLAAFDIRPADEKSGAQLRETVFSRGLVSCPEEFQCKITPRSARWAELVEQAYDATGL